MIMLSPIYEEKCSDCQRNLECQLCKTPLCESCTVIVKRTVCCRPCSVSIRNDKSLVSYFVEWHKSNNLEGVKLLKLPTMVSYQYDEGSTFSVVEFKSKNIIGSVRLRSDAQCDADEMNIITEETIFNEYRILVNNTEINDFLQSVYNTVQKCSSQ